MKKTLCTLLLLPVLLLSLCLPAYAADTEALLLKMNNILDMVEYLALNYDPAVINDDLRAQLTSAIENDPSRFDQLMDDVLSDLDRYSMYLSGGTYDIAFGSEQPYVGIGITMTPIDGKIYVKAIDPTGPAAATGLQVGDILTAVDGQPILSDDTSAVAALVRGEEGTPVRIGILRGTLEMTFTMTRASIEQPVLTGRQMEDGVYYMDLNRFSGEDLDDTFRYYLSEATRLQSKVLILDLRGNPGGDLTAVTNMLGRLIPDAADYFSTADRWKEVTYSAHGRGPRFNQIFLLTDGDSASASEIMTAALCDLNYATSIGQTTYGKGRGQQHLVYPDGSAAVITTLELIPLSGMDYDGIGLTPDYTVADRTAAHPAAACRLLSFRSLKPGDRTWKTTHLQKALCAMGYLEQDHGEADFGPATLDALNRFRADCGLEPMRFLNAESISRINLCLQELSQRTVEVDAPLNTALKLARDYVRQPLQYAADKYGQFKNLK